LKRDEFWPFERLCQLENKYNVKSTFFFLPPRINPIHYLDRLYAYNEKLFYHKKWTKLKDIISDIYLNGWKIGLHAGLESYCNANILIEQKRSLEKLLSIKLDTVRQHFLRFRNDYTWKVQESANFKCDSTYGFNETIGLRSLFCFPFKPFSISKNMQLNLWEIPLAIQDNALFLHEKQNNKSYFEIAKHLLCEVRKVGGVATLLWHSNTVGSKSYPGWLEVYEEILKWATTEGAFIGSIEEIIDWWEYREKQISVSYRFYYVNL
jgi:peptidoglycan/xylan/chitin deacetylase (PgdA/CDA1 family)